MKSKIFFIIGLIVLSGTIIFLPKEVSAHSGFMCWNTPVTYDDGVTTYSFKVCGYTKSGHGNELLAAVQNPVMPYLLYLSPASCGNVTSQLLSYTTDVYYTPAITNPVAEDPVVKEIPVKEPVATTSVATTVKPIIPVCTPVLGCGSDNNVIDTNKCSDLNLPCGPDLTCSAGLCVNPAGKTIDPLTQNVDGTTKGNVIISVLKIGPNTINAYDQNNPSTTGVCNIQWTISQYDSNSSCTITGGHLPGTSFSPTSSSGTSTDTMIKNETTYKLTCGEKITDKVSGEVSLISTSTKYATCNINANVIEVNH